MATPDIIRLEPEIDAAFRVPRITQKAADKASSVLQENHDVNDIIFNDFGLHNHIVHHILATFALGADPDTLQVHYNINAEYQRRPRPLNGRIISMLSDPEEFIKNMNQTENYNNFRLFFTRELERSSVPEVCNKYLFAGDKRANILFNRFFAGYLHPLIHLGYGIEFEQPAIVAEALGQACIHPIWLDPFFDLTEQNVEQTKPKSDGLVNIIDKIRADAKLSTAAHWDDNHKVRDGILKRAKDEMIGYASQWQVSADRLDEAVAEMISACAYFTGCAQNPPKQVKFDFYYMHAVNSSIFFTSFLKQSWISTQNKVKLLEWKGRLDLALYASRRSPKLLLDEITNYPPQDKGQLQSWDTIINRAKVFEDDGHASKFVRALAHGEQVCAPFENSDRFRVKGNMWRQLAQMVMDSVEDSGERWVRSAGFEEAWKDYKDRPSARM